MSAHLEPHQLRPACACSRSGSNQTGLSPIMCGAVFSPCIGSSKSAYSPSSHPRGHSSKQVSVELHLPWFGSRAQMRIRGGSRSTAMARIRRSLENTMHHLPCGMKDCPPYLCRLLTRLSRFPLLPFSAVWTSSQRQPHSQRGPALRAFPLPGKKRGGSRKE